MVNICIRISPRLMSYICIKSKNASQKEEKWKENILNLSYNDIVMTRVHRVRTGKSLPPVSDKYWVGNFPMADKIPRTLKGFCKSTHEKLKFFTTWDNNSSPKKNQQKNNSSYLNSIVVYLSCFQVPWRAFQDPKIYLHRKDRNSRDWGKKKK